MTSRTALTASLLSLAAAGWAMDPATVPPTATVPAPAATAPAAAIPAATPPAAVAPAATGGPLIKPTVVPGEQSIAIDAGDLKQVAKARFFVSRDEGKTWNLAQEIPVDQANPQVPKFAFKPQGDGAYYIVTVTVYRNGMVEPEPKNGSIPAKALLLVVDATSPVVSALDATAEPVTDPSATSVTLNVSWTITDANFASATLEISTDGGASFVSTQAIAATGTAKLTVARTKDNTIQLRILAKDSAGNQAPSLAKTITLPLPPDPEKALAAAVSSLPTLAEVQPPPEETPAKPADAATGATPAATTSGATPLAAAPQPSVPTTTTRDTTPPAGPFLGKAEAEPLLADARAKRKAGDVDGAHGIYLQLFNSTVAQTAVAEDLAMLRANGDHAAVVAIADNLQPELRTDAVRLEHGKALVLVGRPADAEATLSRVNKGAPEAREALLALGKAEAALGKNAIATRIWDKLADGDDAVAQEARLQRGK